MYSEDDLLMLSGIQHIAFCERQYALIYIEQEWVENLLTAEGRNLHHKVDDPFENEKRANYIVWRSVPVVSYYLGLRGIADIVELRQINDKSPGTIELPGETGFWEIIPVEYKRGKPKPDYCDEVQLCAQAICLEEMHRIHIHEGFIFYGQTRHRHPVQFSADLRIKVNEYAEKMHHLDNAGITPPPVLKKGCPSCSLKGICLPNTLAQKKTDEYLDQLML
jgi:CRISPR-associated exonuclease Cas4